MWNMRKAKIILGMLAVLCSVVLIYWVVRSENTAVLQPKGSIAQSELNLIITNIVLMLVIIVPTFVILLKTAWKYRSHNTKATYDPESDYGIWGSVLLWTLPSIIVIVMAVITWEATHRLDPYKPLESDKKPLTIQVVALDWKWLFIYPEEGIATVNFVPFPDRTPIRFTLAADGSPMNSFWIPELSGQIYSMTGMITVLHVIADGPGEYRGKAAEINGEGYADMTFVAKSLSQSDFDAWVHTVKKSPLHLTSTAYNDLLKRSTNNPITLYADVEKDLFDQIVMKFMHSHTTS